MITMKEQVVSGTAQEIAEFLQGASLGDTRLRLIVPIEPSEETDESDRLPPPPLTLQNKAHLEALLLEGINSGEPTRMDDADWASIRREVRERLARKEQP